MTEMDMDMDNKQPRMQMNEIVTALELEEDKTYDTPYSDEDVETHSIYLYENRGSDKNVSLGHKETQRVLMRSLTRHINQRRVVMRIMKVLYKLLPKSADELIAIFHELLSKVPQSEQKDEKEGIPLYLWRKAMTIHREDKEVMAECLLAYYSLITRAEKQKDQYLAAIYPFVIDAMIVHADSPVVNEHCCSLLSHITLSTPLRTKLMAIDDPIKFLTNPIRNHENAIPTVQKACSVLVNLVKKEDCRERALKQMEELKILDLAQPLVKKVKGGENYIRTLVGHLTGQYPNTQLVKTNY